MIPDHLTLKNFMCYKDASLDLDGVHLACLSGDNGAGKSSVLEAITWALWGKARAGDDDLISQGEIESEVDFVFTVSQNQYRVNRRRSKKGAGQTALNFYAKKPDGSWNNIGETGVRAIQEQIIKTIRTRYDTFINSAFLLQGRADSFTVKTAGERKKVLAEILELNQYDEYEKQAKEQAKEADGRRKELDEELKRLMVEINRRPEYERQKEEAETLLEAGRNPLRRQEENLTNLKTRQAQLQSSGQKLSEARKHAATLQRDLQQLDETKANSERKLKEAQIIVARRAEIEAGVKAFNEAKTIEDGLSQKFSQLNNLNRSQNQLEKTIDQQRAQLQIKLDKTEADLNSLKNQVAQLPRLETEHKELQVKLKVAQEATTALETRKTERANLQGDLKQLEAEVKRLSADLVKIKAKADRVPQPGDRCDHCGTVLDEEARDRTIQEYRNEYRKVQEEQKSENAQIDKLNGEIQTLNQLIAQLTKEAQPCGELQNKSGQLEGQMDIAREAEKQITRLTTDQQGVKKLLDAREYARAEQQKLVVVLKEITELDYDEATHKEARQRREELKHFETEFNRLDNALLTLKRESESLEKYALDEKRYKEQLKTQEDEIARYTAEISGLSDLSQQVRQLDLEIREAKDRQKILEKQVWEAESKIKNCEQLTLQKEKVEKEHSKAAEDKSIFSELAEAFGKKGVQAMVIDSALPEIEDEANRLLGDMTDGRMHVRFDTQRDSKKGDTAIETLELYIADEYGPRPYELYSGGEAFRVNFAVRVALSKLLARRSGAQLRTLFIDEGFGSQDGQGRERLVDIIRSIEKDFDRILVITHIQELKDVFPVRIDVVKTPNGSTISVN